MRKFVLTFLCMGTLVSFSQEEGTKFKVSFESSLHSYKMKELNEFLADTSTFLPKRYDSSSINSGTRFGLNVSYRIHPLVAVGLESSYQQGIDKRTPNATNTDPFTSEVTYYTTDSEIKTTNLSFGINATLSIDEILNFNEKSGLLKKIGVDIVLSGGIGYSELTGYVYNPFFNSESFDFNHQSRNSYFSSKLKLGYRLSNNPIFTQVGLSFGYQLMKTNPVQNDAGLIFEHTQYESREIRLDFSGFNYGLYLTIGK